jgi:hypothetical protein
VPVHEADLISGWHWLVEAKGVDGNHTFRRNLIEFRQKSLFVGT